MADFFQNGLITTLHDLRTASLAYLEDALNDACTTFPLGLVIPVTAADMRQSEFRQIVQRLSAASFLSEIVIVLNRAQDLEDYRECFRLVSHLQPKLQLVWADSPRMTNLYQELTHAGIQVDQPGKGRAVWTAYGVMLGNPSLKGFLVHDADIKTYSLELLCRLALPVAHPTFDFHFCKAFYARFSTCLHGRVARLLVTPILRALISCLGTDRYLLFLDSFRYPLSGEFAITSDLAKINRIPADWGLEIGTLAEVYRNVSVKRVCQVDICPQYDHKHHHFQPGSDQSGLARMAKEILQCIFHSVSAMGIRLQNDDFFTIRSAYLRHAQDAIRQYAADAVMNGLQYDRHSEESISEAFSQQIIPARENVLSSSANRIELPNWARVLSFSPKLPQTMREIVNLDMKSLRKRAIVQTA